MPDKAASVDQLIRDLKPLGRSVPLPTPTPPIGVRRTRLRPIAAPLRRGPAWACVGLGALLGIAITQWPYVRDCGWGLFFYIFATSMVVVAGIWGLLITWKSRFGVAHTVALATLVWGLALAAGIVLPRAGYAKTDACWRCVSRV